MTKLRPIPDAFGHAIFCDDIRMEVGNKLTFAGCYFGVMFLNSDFPATIPRLCVSLEYSQQRDKVILPIKFVIFLPGDPDDKPSIEFEPQPEINENALEDIKANSIAMGVSPDIATVTFQIGIGSISISQPGAIKVRAVRGDELVRLGTLKIMRAVS
jgi:hypothetical protein